MLTMCDYYGMCDENGRCVGHPVKVTKEYGTIIKGFNEDIRLVCSPCVIDGVIGSDATADETGLFAEIVQLPYDISIVGNGIGKRIVDKFKLFKNISIALKNKGTIFFYQVDFFFFLYLKLFYRRSTDRKIVILIYHQDFTGGRFAGVLKRIYEKALVKVDTVIYTQKGALVPHDNAVWMPDFIYRADEYDKYRGCNKTDRVVCLGTMSRYKQIEELVDAWRRYEGLPQLIIAGRFDTKDRVEKLSVNLPGNIILRDEVLSYDEYMTMLSESKYCILPYDMGQYKNRTSGVLLESIYCGVIPIAPEVLLKQNMLPGIGYKNLTEIRNLLGDNTDKIKELFDSIYKEYGLEYAAGVLKNTLSA
ncbi:MAG: hypothetical protein K5868_02155 [Lachnospiraceae bacterium]|nr:hypothetical protein [Lachnospiraceae bacterium]